AARAPGPHASRGHGHAPGALRHPASATATRPHLRYASLPLSFEQNAGQTDSQVRFLSRGKSYSLFLTSSEAVLVLNRSAPRRTQRTRRGAGKARRSSADRVPASRGTHPYPSTRGESAPL